MNTTPRDAPVLVAGGGIGGLAAALALVNRGFEVKVLEQAAELGVPEDRVNELIEMRSWSGASPPARPFASASATPTL